MGKLLEYSMDRDSLENQGKNIEQLLQKWVIDRNDYDVDISINYTDQGIIKLKCNKDSDILNVRILSESLLKFLGISYIFLSDK